MLTVEGSLISNQVFTAAQQPLERIRRQLRIVQLNNNLEMVVVWFFFLSVKTKSMSDFKMTVLKSTAYLEQVRFIDMELQHANT